MLCCDHWNECSLTVLTRLQGFSFFYTFFILVIGQFSESRALLILILVQSYFYLWHLPLVQEHHWRLQFLLRQGYPSKEEKNTVKRLTRRCSGFQRETCRSIGPQQFYPLGTSSGCSFKIFQNWRFLFKLLRETILGLSELRISYAMVKAFSSANIGNSKQRVNTETENINVIVTCNCLYITLICIAFLIQLTLMDGKM